METLMVLERLLGETLNNNRLGTQFLSAQARFTLADHAVGALASSSSGSGNGNNSNAAAVADGDAFERVLHGAVECGAAAVRAMDHINGDAALATASSSEAIVWPVSFKPPAPDLLPVVP